LQGQLSLLPIRCGLLLLLLFLLLLLLLLLCCQLQVQPL
jgi:hypothetical protein